MFLEPPSWFHVPPDAGQENTYTVSIVKTTVTAAQVIFTTIPAGDVIPVPGTATAPPAIIATPIIVVPLPTKPDQEVPPYPTGPTAGPTAPVGRTSETPAEKVSQNQQPLNETLCLGGCPKCSDNEVPTPAPTFVPVSVGTTAGSIGTLTKLPGPTAGSIGTLTKLPGPTNSVPIFTGAGSKNAVYGFMAAGAAIAFFL